MGIGVNVAMNSSGNGSFSAGPCLNYDFSTAYYVKRKNEPNRNKL
jgi:hypothetical protein